MTTGPRRHRHTAAFGLVLTLALVCCALLRLAGSLAFCDGGPEATSQAVEVLDEPAPSQHQQPLGSTELPAGQTEPLSVTSQQVGSDVPATTLIPDDASYVEGEVLVGIAPGTTAEQVQALLASTDTVGAHEVTPEELESGMLQLEVAPGASVEDAIGALSGSGLVDAQPNYIYYALQETRSEEELNDLLSVDAAVQEEVLEEQLSAQEDAVGPNDEATSLGGEEGSEGTNDQPDEGDLNEVLRAVVDDPLAADQWALESVRAYEAWAQTVCDGSVSIAILDERPDASHADLAANIIATYDAQTQTETLPTAASHGTHVAGIASAAANNGTGVAGVSHNAGLVMVNVFDKSRDASKDAWVTNTALLVRAYAYLEAHQDAFNTRVVNLSLGIKTSGKTSHRDDRLISCIDKAMSDYGIVTVAAAGNSELAKPPYYEYPGDADNVVSVVNLRRGSAGGTETLSSLSNYNVPGQSGKNIAAPGTGILSTVPGDSYGSLTGTSMAAPHVSGVLALEFAANPQLTATEAVNILYATARDLGEEGFDDLYGWGEVDARAAVLAAKTGEYPGLPDISARTAPEPVVTGPTKVPVGATATFGVTDGTLELTGSDGVATFEGGTLTGLAAGTATLAVRDLAGEIRFTHTVTVYETSGCWNIASPDDPKYVLDVKGASVNNSANVLLYTANGNNNQVWLLERQDDGTFLVRSAKSGKVLDVARGSKAAGANVLQYAPSNKAWQKWRIVANADNTVTFVNAHSSKVLEMDGATPANGRNVRQGEAGQTSSQRWVIKGVRAEVGPIWDGVYKVTSGINVSYALDVRGSSRANGANVQLWRSRNADNQRWRFEHLGGGEYKITNVRSGKVLDVARASLKNSANVTQWTWNGGGNQRWRLVRHADGTFTIVRSGTTMALDAKGARAANGTNVHQYARKDHNAQRWHLTQL